MSNRGEDTVTHTDCESEVSTLKPQADPAKLWALRRKI
jgi:hypothetical protein